LSRGTGQPNRARSGHSLDVTWLGGSPDEHRCSELVIQWDEATAVAGENYRVEPRSVVLLFTEIDPEP